MVFVVSLNLEPILMLFHMDCRTAFCMENRVNMNDRRLESNRSSGFNGNVSTNVNGVSADALTVGPGFENHVVKVHGSA